MIVVSINWQKSIFKYLLLLVVILTLSKTPAFSKTFISQIDPDCAGESWQCPARIPVLSNWDSATPRLISPRDSKVLENSVFLRFSNTESGVHIEIQDSEGEVVFSDRINKSFLAVRSFKPGFYFVSASNENGSSRDDPKNAFEIVSLEERDRIREEVKKISLPLDKAKYLADKGYFQSAIEVLRGLDSAEINLFLARIYRYQALPDLALEKVNLALSGELSRSDRQLAEEIRRWAIASGGMSKKTMLKS